MRNGRSAARKDHHAVGADEMWTLQAPIHAFRRHLLRGVPRNLKSVAVRRWEIARAETSERPRAHFLPNQLDRVSGWAFSDEHPGAVVSGGAVVSHAATSAWLVDNVWLIDGAIYKGDACLHLAKRVRHLPAIKVEREIHQGAMYCTPGGNQYFGQWLLDDCATYPLAAAEGEPVTTAHAMTRHTAQYEAWFEMTPSRVRAAYIRKAILFDDVGQNSHKRRRVRSLCSKLIARVAPEPHAGIFLLRGSTGQRRVLRNELEIAELLQRRRGFRILDSSRVDLPTIVTACAGARIIAGVEGSQLMHGMMVLGSRGGLFTIQPPNRFVTLLKDVADRDGQQFGFVVGIPEEGDFRADPDEVMRTLDLFRV